MASSGSARGSGLEQTSGRAGGFGLGGGSALARWCQLQRTALPYAERREAGVGDAGSGSLVNSPNVKFQFCNFNVSPSS